MLIDDFLPTFDASERHQILIQASPARVYEALLTTDFGRPLLVRALLALRALPAWLLHPARSRRVSRKITFATFLQNGFVRLAERQAEEIVLGLVGRFWTLSGCLEQTDAAAFQHECRPGLAKAAWNFTIESSGQVTKVVTETRVQCTDRQSRRRFRAYWLLIRPFSGLLRRYMLRELRRAAERQTGDRDQ
ncbi:MAG: hypothetical protein V7641_338 [Blastocatellia bacterium]